MIETEFGVGAFAETILKICFYYLAFYANEKQQAMTSSTPISFFGRKLDEEEDFFQVQNGSRARGRPSAVLDGKGRNILDTEYSRKVHPCGGETDNEKEDKKEKGKRPISEFNFASSGSFSQSS